MKITQKEVRSLYDKYIEDLQKNKETIFQDELNKVYDVIKKEYMKGMCSYHINLDYNISYECREFIYKELGKEGYICCNHGYGSIIIDIYWAGDVYDNSLNRLKDILEKTIKKIDENNNSLKSLEEKSKKKKISWIKKVFSIFYWGKYLHNSPKESKKK